jgi:hypothetical protein
MNITPSERFNSNRDPQHGSALVMAIFVLVLLTGMGAALLFTSQHEGKMSRTSLHVKKAFYLAESAIEDGRRTLFITNGENPFDDDLEDAAGDDDNINFNPKNIEAVYDGDGTVTGFTGAGDDEPLRAFTAIQSDGELGWYTAYLTNDPVEGPTSKTDGNGRVMITGIGAGDDRSVEIVQAIIEPHRFLPAPPPAALTMIGENPEYDNGDSNAQNHTGDDCGNPGGAFAPIVGTTSAAAAAIVKDDMNRPEEFHSGPGWEREDTIGDMNNPADPIVADAGNGTLDPAWMDCQRMKELVQFLAIAADYYCNADTDACTLSSNGPDDVVFIDGDLANTPAGNFEGTLVVTGELVYNGNTGWDGVILAIGEGRIIRSGGGGGIPSGGVVMANIDPTPDGPAIDKSDWCDNGLQPAHYETSGGGNSTVQWCSATLDLVNPLRSYRVTEFLQR